MPTLSISKTAKMQRSNKWADTMTITKSYSGCKVIFRGAWGDGRVMDIR
jgi:hypothetical protein